MNTIRVSNSLDPDQDLHFVGPDLGPNCLQRLSADDKSLHLQGMSESLFVCQMKFSHMLSRVHHKSR